MKGMMKGPLIIAAVLVIGRVLMEQSGAPFWLTNLFSVVILYVFIAPIYFAFRIANSGIERPYRTLFKKTALFTALARAMVIPMYWLAYYYQWTAPRFSVQAGGNVGPNVTPLMGYVGIPLMAATAWILISLIAGGGLGSIVIRMKRKSSTRAVVPS
jgi:hypothetical protein